MGLVHIYCGDGKGKTTAAVGLALRMAGNDRKVVLVRFLKNEDSGEVRTLRGIPGVEVLPCTKCFGFTWQMTGEEKQQAAEHCKIQFQKAWDRAVSLCESRETDADVLLVLDEAAAALEHGLLQLSGVLDCVDHRPANLEIVFTGRRMPGELLERADYVTEMKAVRHPYARGIRARRGIEY